MPRRVTLIVFLGLVTTLVLTTGISAGAAPGDDVRSTQSEIAAAQARLMEIRTDQSTAQAAYDDALFEMNELNGRIADATEDLAAGKERLAAAQESLEQRASQVYMSGNVAFMNVLVEVDNFSDFAARMDLWLRLLGQERAEYEAVLEAKNELAAHKERLETQRAQRVEAVEEALAQKKEAAKVEAEAQAYLDSLNGELRAAIWAEHEREAELARAAAAEALEQAPAEVAAIEAAPVVPQANFENQQATADERAAAAASAAAAAEEAARLAEKRAAEERAAAEAAAAEEAAAARAAAAKDARREAREQAELAEERAAQRRAARERAEREAELARERAEIEEAAAQQAAAERAAARRAAEQRAAMRAEWRAANQETAEKRAEWRAANQETAEKRAEWRAANQAKAERRASATPTASSTASAPANGGSGGGEASGPASGSASSVIAEARTHLGTPYQLGSCIAYKAEDCSCFTMLVYQQFGIALPDNPGAQMGYGTPVSGPAAAGDLVFWAEGGGGITHVGIAMGDGTTIHASNYTGDVTITPINHINGYAGARRLL